jgi:2'-5' RNA ligase
MIRTFVALPTTPETQRRLEDIQNTLRASGADVKWDDPGKFHITLKFIGDFDENRVAELEHALRKRLEGVRAFRFSYSGVGVFPNYREPKIVWAGVDLPETIHLLQMRIEEGCQIVGIPLENRRFHPHITFGRVRGTRNRTGLIEALNTLIFDPISALCDKIEILKRDLHPEGSLYSLLANIPLLS